MSDQIKSRGDTLDNWERTNPILGLYEIAIADNNGKRSGKIGTGQKRFKDLPFVFGDEAADVSKYYVDEHDADTLAAAIAYMKSYTQAGDTLTTLRTDLDADWLLCNGSFFRVTDYPDLAKLTSSQIEGQWNTAGGVTSYNLASFYKYLTYGDGWWVAIFVNEQMYCYYGEDPCHPGNEWTLISPPTVGVRSVTYANGWWVAVTRYGTISYRQGNPNQSWSNANTVNASYVYMDVAFGGGWWVAVGAYSNTGVVVCCQGNPNGTWSDISVVGANVYFRRIAYGNGWWAGTTDRADTLYYKQGAPNTSWGSSVSIGVIPNDIKHNGTQWVITGGSNILFNDSSPNGAWSASALPLAGKSLSNTLSATYFKGQWIISGTYAIVAGTVTNLGPGIAVTTGNISASSDYHIALQYTSNLNCPYFYLASGNNYVGGIMNYSSSNVSPQMLISSASPEFHSLPIITIADAYTYIKAKQDKPLIMGKLLTSGNQQFMVVIDDG